MTTTQKTISISEIIKKYENDEKISIAFNSSLDYYIALELTDYCGTISPIFYPIKIGEKTTIQFTNFMFDLAGSGDIAFLIIQDEKYKFLRSSYEPDCDGEMQINSIHEIEEMDKYEISVRPCYKQDLFKLFESL